MEDEFEEMKGLSLGFNFLTLGEGSMLPRDRLRIVIQSSTGPLRTVKLTKQVMMAMYKIVI